MARTLYLHTIDGHPGAFDGYQVCYIGHGRKAWAEPCVSLRQIRKQQAMSRANRIRDGLRDDSKYDYVKVRV